MEQLQPPGHCCEIRLTGRRQRHQRKGQVGPAATAGGGRGGKASTPALGPGEASERQRGLVFVQKAQELQGDSRGCPGPCSTARKGAGSSTGDWPRGSARARPQQEQPWAHWHRRMSPETEETLLHHVPAEPPPPFCSQGWDWEPPPCRQRAAPGLASLPEGRGCSELLMRDMHARAWLGIRGAPVPDPATRGSCCSCRRERGRESGTTNRPRRRRGGSASRLEQQRVWECWSAPGQIETEVLTPFFHDWDLAKMLILLRAE
nr:uncharacterized protein LOC106629329 isoform X2 [Zonotrichia albicollis]